MDDFEDTLYKATMLVGNYRGKISARDRKIVYSLIGGGVFAVLLAVIIGMIM